MAPAPAAKFRAFQRRWDRTVYRRIPGTDLRVALRLFRDASWILTPTRLEAEVRSAFALLLELLQPRTFWDVGANIGFYSWYVRRHPAVREVVLFEPDPTNFALITKTIRKNAISDCRAMNLALSDRTGEEPFLVDPASGAAGSLARTSQQQNTQSLHYAYGTSETILCRTATIDGLIGDGLPPPDLLKLDVEGAEHLVLSGATSFLARHRPTMIIETDNPELVRRLMPSDYTAFRIDGHNLIFSPMTDASHLARLRQAFPSEPPH